MTISTRAHRPPLRRAMLIGLLGTGVAPSLTPPMHELEGARHGMHYVYRPVDVADATGLDDLIAAARRFGFDGLNVTHPLKQAVVELLDDLAPSARDVGAVNTVVFTDAGAVGHNTDVTGFRAAFDDAFPGERHDHIVLLGAGGGGAAVATALARGPVGTLSIVDADPERARALAAHVTRLGQTAAEPAAPAQLADLLATADVIVNATPVGMAAHPGAPFDLALLEPRHSVADIVYRPVRTPLLEAAAQRGCRTMPGLGMAMHQAADAFEIFTGERADRAAMHADLNDLVAAEAAGDLPSRQTPRGDG